MVQQTQTGRPARGLSWPARASSPVYTDSDNEDEEKINEETCIMAQSSNKVFLRIGLEPGEWIKDCGFSKHMTGNKSLVSTYKACDEGDIVFGSNLKGKIIGKGTVSNESLTISNENT
ncbi:hypothetical protein Tco_1251880 [Tanacetum coccineum]